VLLVSGLLGCASSPASDASDARITAQVRVRLGQYSELQSPNSLDVQTLHRVVYLRGLMATPFQIRLAGSVAAEVAGVRRVQNLIGLSSGR
jgi:osmotically-inducible protein OsmY